MPHSVRALGECDVVVQMLRLHLLSTRLAPGRLRVLGGTMQGLLTGTRTESGLTVLDMAVVSTVAASSVVACHRLMFPK